MLRQMIIWQRWPCCSIGRVTDAPHVVQALDEGLHAEADEDLAEFVEAEEDEEAEENADEDADQELEYEDEDNQVGNRLTGISLMSFCMRPGVCRTCAGHMTQECHNLCKALV